MTEENFKRYVKAMHKKCRETKECGDCALTDICFNGFDTEKFVAKVDEWCKAHPAKTYAQDFFEKFPKAKKTHDGIPLICVGTVYGTDMCHKFGGMCQKCWHAEMWEEENEVCTKETG